MTLYELAKNALQANQATRVNNPTNPDITVEAISEFAKAAAINIHNNAFGIMLAFTSAQLIVQAVEEDRKEQITKYEGNQNK
jgi:hypothetical protein